MIMDCGILCRSNVQGNSSYSAYYLTINYLCPYCMITTICSSIKFTLKLSSGNIKKFALIREQKGQTHEISVTIKLQYSTHLYTIKVHNIKFCLLLNYSPHVLHCHLNLNRGRKAILAVTLLKIINMLSRTKCIPFFLRPNKYGNIACLSDTCLT